MRKTVTISLDEHVYDELCRAVGPHGVGVFIESLLKPHLADGLEKGYRNMAADLAREAEAVEWMEGTTSILGKR